MRTADWVAAFVVAYGNRALARATPIAFDRLEDVHVRFSRGDVTYDSFNAWIADAKPTRLFALGAARARESNPNLLVVTRGPRGIELHQSETITPPRTTLVDKDVVDFVERQPDAALLEKRCLTWNANVNWTNDWQKYAARAREPGRTDLVESFPSILAATLIPEPVREAWNAIYEAHRTRDRSVTFDFRFLRADASLVLTVDRDVAATRLADALEAIAAFATEQKLEGWAKRFRDARAAIDRGGESALVKRYFGDAGFDAKSLGLLDAAWSADVFGGMGSWNDVAPKGRYTEVTHALSEAIPIAVEAALAGLNPDGA